MEAIQDWLLSNLFSILFIIFILTFIYNWKKKSKKMEQIKVELDKKVNEANEKNLKVSIQASGDIQTDSKSNSNEIGGDTTYEGSTGDLQWKLTSSVIFSTRSNSDHPSSEREVWKRKSQWFTSFSPLPKDSYVAIMGTPGNAHSGKEKMGGFFGKVVNFISDKVFDIYVIGYFGSRFASLVNVAQDEILKIPGLDSYFIVTNVPDIAKRFFDDQTVGVLVNWKKEKQGFKQEGSVDLIGFLFHDGGAVAGCQASMENASEAKMLADFCSTLSFKMQQAIGGHQA
jgi:hypothetical protein